MALGGLVACSTLATAQDAATKDAKKGGKRGFPTIEQQMERMTEALTLTDDQKPKVKAVLEETSKKRQAIFTDSSLDRSAMREKMQPINDEQKKKMKEILTADQFKKYEELQQQRGKQGGKKKKSE
jgi:Spy/CpxP family protein refolding chaperone